MERETIALLAFYCTSPTTKLIMEYRDFDKIVNRLVSNAKRDIPGLSLEGVGDKRKFFSEALKIYMIGFFAFFGKMPQEAKEEYAELYYAFEETALSVPGVKECLEEIEGE